MKVLILQPTGSQKVDGYVRWSCELIRKDGQQVRSRDVLWFEAPEHDQAALQADDGEPFLIAALMQAMKEARDMEVRGRVSKMLLQNLEEYMAFWVATAPKVFSSVQISADMVSAGIPDSVASDPLGTEAAMAAFSGGLDATFLAWRHHTGRAGWRSRQIRFFVMLSGFDIQYNESAHVDASMSNAIQTLGSIGASLKTLRTNLRKVLDVPWNHLHGTALVACMHFYKHQARTMLLGSCEKYDDLIIPWGSSPISDPLLSSSSLRVIHDSAEFSRSEKAAGIADWPAGQAHLRVCWLASNPGGNCLKCEKCLRTMANFASQGLPVPSSLGGSEAYLNKYIFRTKLRTQPQEAEWRAIAAAGVGRKKSLWQYWVPVMLAFSKLRRAYYVATGQGARAGVNR